MTVEKVTRPPAILLFLVLAVEQYVRHNYYMTFTLQTVAHLNNLTVCHTPLKHVRLVNFAPRHICIFPAANAVEMCPLLHK